MEQTVESPVWMKNPPYETLPNQIDVGIAEEFHMGAYATKYNTSKNADERSQILENMNREYFKDFYLWD